MIYLIIWVLSDIMCMCSQLFYKQSRSCQSVRVADFVIMKVMVRCTWGMRMSHNALSWCCVEHVHFRRTVDLAVVGFKNRHGLGGMSLFSGLIVRMSKGTACSCRGRKGFVYSWSVIGVKNILFW